MQNSSERYSRHYSLPGFGKEKQERLLASKVLVIGAGGLGCPVLQYLVAAGVGTIGIVDGDKVEISNLQRQVLFGDNDIGAFKSLSAKAKLSAQNPDISIFTYEEFLNVDNALKIMSGYDVVVDGTDNFESRYLINDAAVILGIPVVFGSILEFEGQVSVFNYGEDGPTYRCLFPEPPYPLDAPNCSEIGVIGVLPGLIGTLQANEVIKILTGIGEPLSGKLLITNALTNSQCVMRYTLIKENKEIDKLESKDYACEIEAGLVEIEAVDFIKSELYWSTRIVDVRSETEFSNFNRGGINIPLQMLPEKVVELKSMDRVLLLCQSGQRSDKALKYLKEQGLNNVVHLKGGINAIGVVD
ncbi:ThiF family adenylyltransferase [Echinicola salinicaeni]|uniref:ThiF family adenylyltransferase n=1 Tax=Echinicola salinicaeni TaxID=2762757 RepID=UPI001648555E|nr:ThiF family adenylyltransferase [Echinicola salinicaeni]